MTRTSIKHMNGKRESDSKSQVGSIILGLAKRKIQKFWVKKKLSKFQWKREPKQIKGDNPNNIKRKASKHLGKNKEGILKM